MKLYICENSFVIEEINEQFIKEYNKSPFNLLYKLAINNDQSESIELNYLTSIAYHALNTIISRCDIEFIRENIETTFDEDEIKKIYDNRPFFIGDNYFNTSYIKLLINETYNIFKSEISKYKGTVESYFASFNKNLKVANRLYFHLVENKNDDEFPFAFLATYANEKSKHVPLNVALKEFKKDDKKLYSLMAPLTKIANKDSFINKIVKSGEIFYPTKMSVKEAYLFLKNIPLFEQNGIYCRIPNFWKKKSLSFAKLSLNIESNNKSLLGYESILNFDPKIIINGEEFNKEDIEKLLETSEGLRLIKGRWIEINHEKLSKLLDEYKKYKSIGDFNFFTANRLIMESVNNNDESVEINYSTWLNSFIEKLKNPNELIDAKIPSTFIGKLRKYQNDGFKYLLKMYELKLCPLIADDMGLGKTIQIIVFLSHILQKKINKKVLLIVPASLIGNWISEFNKFAPIYEVNKLISNTKNLKEDIKENGIYLTTYGMISKLDNIKKITWDFLILDEAQAIKNIGTKQNREINSLSSKFRIALTGTPIENSLSDLYSIFDFLNPGMLGNRSEFKLLCRVMEDKKDYSKLRNITSIFTLRRVKTDKNIIQDLPLKIINKNYPLLSKEQTILYKECVKDLEGRLDISDGIGRKGLILSTILKLKQICNHPDQYIGSNVYKLEQSGKFILLKELVTNIISKHERVLIFTQFKEIIPYIYDMLKSSTGLDGLILTGSTSIKERTKLIERFNSKEYIPFFILSLKAGGVGLNLTSANNVVHFDRWWNASVENQASDRSYRIGQNKNVMIYTFTCRGTIEEKIDEMIESKKNLSDNILVENQEKWITELSNKDIIKLCSLRSD